MDGDDGLAQAALAQARGGDRAVRARRGPLAGVRIADFCWVGVGALATRLLADLGAEVIKIEDGKRLDLTRRLPIYKNEPVRPFGQEKPNLDPNASGMFNNYNRNKLGVTIDMRTPEGREAVERLIAVSDMVTENFAPDVMERWGLSYERVAELNPKAIYARMSGFGHDGLYAGYRSYGPVVQAVSGLSHISGLPGREPSGWGMSYMDNQAAYYNSNALLMALYNRNITGKGCQISVSAVEAGITLVGPLLLDVAVNGKSTRGGNFPTGNRHPYKLAAPHGVYPAAGEDCWIAIAVFDDDDWCGLLSVMGEHAVLVADACFADQAARNANQDLLDERIAAWAQRFDAHELMHRLQHAGVAAAAVQTAQQVIDQDPQIAARELYFELDHPVIGEAQFEGVPIRFSRTEKDVWRSGPLLGEDNAYVLRDLLGYSEAEYADLLRKKVIGS